MTLQLDDRTLDQIASQATEAWHLTVSNLELISKSENVVFRVETTDEQTLVLRIHRPGYHTLNELESEQMWTAALNNSGVHVPVPRMLPNGAGYTRVAVPDTSDYRYVGMVEWFEGVPLVELMEETSDQGRIADYFRQLGKIMAKIHNQATAWEVPRGFQRHAWDADGLMGDAPFWGQFWDLPQMNEAERKRILAARDAIHRILTDYGKNGSPDDGTYSLIHSDFHAGNLLINGDQLHVIDFDDAGFGWHQYDLAVALFHYQESPEFGQRHDTLIEGYRSVRTLTDQSVEMIPLFMLIRAMAQIGWTYARPELGLGERRARMITRVCEQADRLGL